MAQGRQRAQRLRQGFFGVWIACSAAGVVAQEPKTTLVMPSAPLLPQQAGEWARQPENAAPPTNPDSRLDTVLTEDGLKRSDRAAYRVGAAGPTVTITAREFIDATGAHAAYSYLQKPGSAYRGVGLGDETNLTGDHYLFRSGTSIVEAEGGRGEKIEALLSRIQVGLPKVGGPKGLAPKLPALLPAKGLQRDSVRYALGPVSYEALGGVLPGAILGFDKAAEAVTAKYAGKGSLTLLTYPTPEIAGDRLRAIEEEIHREGGKAGTVVLRRTGTLVGMTSGAWGLADAKETLQGINPKMDVTWNKQMPPEFHVEVRKTYSLLSSILIFSGFGALAAIVLGVGLGAGRAGIRVLQGKPAASEPEFLRIDLSGSAVPLQQNGNRTETKG